MNSMIRSRAFLQFNPAHWRRTRRHWRLHLFCLLAVGSVGIAATAFADEASHKTAAGLSAAAYLGHIQYLASDELGGRGTGTPEIERAAEYLAQQFKAAGLQPAGDNGSWFQSFEVRMRRVLVPENATLRFEGLEEQPKLGVDWTPLPFSGDESIEGPLAFAGYGIDAAEFNYNDFAGIDPQGKVLLVFRYEPRDKDPEADFGGESSSRYSFFQRKAQMAAEKGAKALLIVNPPDHPSVKDDSLYEFGAWNTRASYALPMAHVTRAFAEKLLAKAGLPGLVELQKKLDDDRKSVAADIGGLSVRMAPGLEPCRTRNVLALLPGDGSTNDVVVVGAHYDHLGLAPAFGGGGKPEIHNGADDNASGTAGLLELARVLASEPKLKCGVLFIAFSAEELGLFGSRHFVDHPTVELSNIRAMMNFDMIGRLRPDSLEITGIATAQEFGELVKKAAADLSLEYSNPRRIRSDSDHAPFHRKDIPVLFIFTGLHDDYHRPGDDIDKVNIEGAVKVLMLGHRLIREIADLPNGLTRPTSTEGSAESSGEGPQAARQRSGDDGAARPRVRLGILPAYDDAGPGMLIESVIENGAAAKGGMKDGDRVLRIGDTEVNGIEKYMEAMRGFSSGDTAKILVKRGEETLTIEVKLVGARREPS